MLRVRIPTVWKLNKLALQYIFDRDSMAQGDVKELNNGLHDQLRKSGLTKIELNEIRHIINQLIKNEKGGFVKEKEMMRQHNLDYRQVYRRGL